MTKRPNRQRSFGSLSQGDSQSTTGHAIELSGLAKNASGAGIEGEAGGVFVVRL